jgi:ribosome-associated protein
MSTSETPQSRAPALTITSSIQVPLDEFEFTYARSSGPGGQNVNKVNSKALLRWPVRSSPSLPEGVRQRFLNRYGNRVTAEGDVLISSQRYRDQAKNVDDCLAKLQEMLAAVAVAPVRRKRTKPSRSSIKRRLDNKRHTSDKKRGRREID